MEQIKNLKEQLVSFQIAKLAYEAGYNVYDMGSIKPMYCVDGTLYMEKLGYQLYLEGQIPFDAGFILAPTTEELIKWLKDKKHINISILTNKRGSVQGRNRYSWYFEVSKTKLPTYLAYGEKSYLSRKLCMERGMQHALLYVIKYDRKIYTYLS